MTAHLIATTPKPAVPAGGWLRLSAALTEHAETLTGRDDLTVTCAPGAGHGAPGCFIPALATIELDGTHLGHNPSTCNPRRPSNRERYPALWGVFLHESAHVRHSHWHIRIVPTINASADTSASGGGARSAHLEAATMLEESRIEAAHLRSRPADRRWLRASARQLVLADFTTPTPGTATGTTATATGAGAAVVPQVAMTPWEAARAAALLLARVDAGVLEAEETASLAATITTVLGPSRLSALSALWHIAHTTADDDHETMLELGRRWCTILGAPPEEPPPTPEDEEEEGAGGESSRPSPLAEAISAALTAVADADTPPPLPAPGPSKGDQRAAERTARRRATRAAGHVFTPGDGSEPDRISGMRQPTPAEQAAARKLARHLKAAAHRERITSTTTSATPPGRLRMRGALAADAQRAAGAIPTAEPFTQTTRRHTPTPPLRLGIACDVSGSMHELAAPIASAAWILAKAAASVPDARSATVIFGQSVQPITYPGKIPARVREFKATDPYEKFCDAVDALDGAVELTRPDAARLLVIVSDGIFREPELIGGQQRITRLIEHGCAVLWLALDMAIPMDGAHLITLTNPADAADVIGRAATRALATT